MVSGKPPSTTELRGELIALIRKGSWAKTNHVPEEDQIARLLEIAHTANDTFIREWHHLFLKQQRIADQIVETKSRERTLHGLQAAFDHMVFGALVIDRNFTMISINHAARDIIATRPFIDIIDNKLTIKNRVLKTDLESSLSNLYTRTGNDIHQLGYHFDPGDTSESLAFQLTLIGEEASGYDAVLETRLILITIVDATTIENLTEAATAQYGLTPKEALLLACLLEGCELEQAAERRKISRNTARNQLSSIFGKTGANRQSDLIRLIMQFPGV